ncbi:rhomboid family intramembrane serine protease [Actinomadura craniellae]|nr:rhomboid family intramembrane serine protease [Actinomadura craniellae]
MRDAAVGHQCHECVREGNKTVRQPRTIFGGRVSATPVVTFTLIAANVLAYLAEIADPAVVDRFQMVGQALLARNGNMYVSDGTPVPGMELVGVANGEPYRLLTSAFLHAPPGSGFGVGHILFNMWALWMIGPQLEQVLGRARFTALYLLSALGGSVLLYLIDPSQPAVGASGAIFGLFGAFFVIGRKLGAPTGGITFLLVINLVITFAVPGISWQGHLGGLVVGALLATAYAYAPARQRSMVHGAAIGSALVVLVALVAAQTVQLTALG